MTAAAAAVEALGVSAADDVLVVCNDEQRPTVVFAPTTYSVSHTQARIAATGRGVRIATMPGITEEIFQRAVSVDYGELKRAGEEIAARLTAAGTCRITSAAGTDVVLTLDGRTAISDDGDLRAPGAFGNLPAGEGFISPLETAGEGTIVFDGSIGGYGLLEEPLSVTLSRGRLVDARGAAAPWLLRTLDAGGEHGRSIADRPPRVRHERGHRRRQCLIGAHRRHGAAPDGGAEAVTD